MAEFEISAGRKRSLMCGLNGQEIEKSNSVLAQKTDNDNKHFSKEFD